MLTVLLDEIYEYECVSLFTYLFETVETGVRGGTAFCVADDEGLGLELLYFGVGESFDRLPKRYSDAKLPEISLRLKLRF